MNQKKRSIKLFFTTLFVVAFALSNIVYSSHITVFAKTSQPTTYNVSGQKFYDENGDGVKTCPEYGLKNWTITITGPDNFSASVKTDFLGFYVFYNLKPGIYTICEVQQNGWQQTAPKGNNGCYVIEVTNKNIGVLNFGNRPTPNPYCGDGIKTEMRNVTTEPKTEFRALPNMDLVARIVPATANQSN